MNFIILDEAVAHDKYRHVVEKESQQEDGVYVDILTLYKDPVSLYDLCYMNLSELQSVDVSIRVYILIPICSLQYSFCAISIAKKTNFVISFLHTYTINEYQDPMEKVVKM